MTNPYFDNGPFMTFKSAEIPKVEVNDPIFGLQDYSDWAQSVTPDGGIIVKPSERFKQWMINNNPQPVDIVPPPVEEELPVPEETKQDSTKEVKFSSKSEWANRLADAYRKLGVSENGIKNLIAKNALESNWGRSTQGKYNYGNITTGGSWKGSYVNGRDKDANGNPIRSKFRSYNSLEEFAADEVEFLTRLYDFDDSDDIDTFANKLKGQNKGKRHYAEARNYKSVLKSVYKNV